MSTQAAPPPAPVHDLDRYPDMIAVTEEGTA